MPNMQQLSASQASPEVPINENFVSLEHQAVYGKNPDTTTGLTWGYLGGRWSGFAITAGTVSLNSSSTVYMVVDRSDGAVSISTASTNWDNTASYARVFKFTTSGSAVTATEDHRSGSGGVHGGSGGAASLGYTPAVLADWDGSADPGDVADALDQLAERITDVEGLGQGTGLDADAYGFRGIPQNSQSSNYTTVAADAGKHLLHPSGAGAGDTFTIDSNANVAYEVGTAITFVNMATDAVSIAITSDTLTWAEDGTTGTRALAQYGIATAVKVTSTGWLISGTGLS